MELTVEETNSLKDKGMPPWGLQFLSLINSRLDQSSSEIKAEIGKVQVDLQNMESRLEIKIETKCDAVLHWLTCPKGVH